MRSTPIEPAEIALDAEGLPYSARYQDIYHPRAGALAQAQHVFIAGNGLPQRWAGRERFVVLETGFGLGNNFLATWQAWHDDPQRCATLVFVSIEQHPLTREALADAQAASTSPVLADALRRAWPPLTHNLHRLEFDQGRVQLLLAFGDVQAWLPELVLSVDAFDLDGFAPARNPRMWDERVCKALGRLAAPDATLATWSAASALRHHLTTAGFAVRRAAGIGGKREITLATYAPRFVPRAAPAQAARAIDPDRHALVIGAGLAGCATAWALSEMGWRSTLFERRDQIASDASGNAAGLFHAIVNAEDGPHARFNRAAALMAAQEVRIAIDSHGAVGAAHGLLRLETLLDLSQMRALTSRLRLPADFVRALSADEAGDAAGIALAHPAWYFVDGGWVQPKALAGAWLVRAGRHVETRLGHEVHALQREGDRWYALDAHGHVLARASTVVLANAGNALRLLGDPAWPLSSVRGQISSLPADALPLPRMPIAGAGYLLPEVDGRGHFGASAQVDDDDASVRPADQLANLARLERLLGHPLDVRIDAMEGRTAWRCRAPDRLPIVGAVPVTSLSISGAMAGGAPRLDQARFVPRQPGLYVFIGLGSRGITWSALGARVLAALIAGAPLPIEASLRDAIDPARFVSRAARRR